MSTRFQAALCAMFFALPSYASTPPPPTQGEDVPHPCTGVNTFAWVDPEFGVDGPALSSLNGYPVSTQINDPTSPFKTLQAAIDAVFLHQNALHQPNFVTHGVVFALPGIYGPTDGGGSGDNLPIQMRDRVSVQSANARACVIRAKSNGYAATIPPYTAANAYWPTLPGGRLHNEKVVLVDFSGASQVSLHNLPPPIPGAIAWTAEPDSTELFDGFTLEGGDIQVMFWVQGQTAFRAIPVNAIVTNCVFDMRDGWLPRPGLSIMGPSIGIELVPRYSDLNTLRGYNEQHVLIAQNTFVMASRHFEANGNSNAWIRCREEAVAIIDVTDHACATTVANCEGEPRGIGNPGIFNNLFRTAPDDIPHSFSPMAMLGIDQTDTKLHDATTNTFKESNAFAPTRVGSTNGFFFSTPRTSTFQGTSVLLAGAAINFFDCGTPTTCPPPLPQCAPAATPAGCQPATLPAPAIAIWDWDGVGPIPPGVDPCFVGEYVNSRAQVAIPLGAPNVFHLDWRLLPNSPVADQGARPFSPTAQVLGFNWCALNGFCFTESGCETLRSSDWDFEGYGNPRTVGGLRDIGADETHGYVAAASYGNDSISHNTASANLAPTAASGQVARRLVLSFLASQNAIAINGRAVVPAATPPVAWTQPPSTLTPPLVRNQLPVDYRTQWITFGNPSPTPTPWHNNVQNPGVDNYRPSWVTNAANQALTPVCNLLQGDDETVTPPVGGAYFASQLVMLTIAGVHLRWSNLQFEYR